MPQPLIDRNKFEANFPSSSLYGVKLSDNRRQGFNAIFNFWDTSEHLDTLEWLAYALATAWHETGGRMQPVREGFATSDAAAYAAVTAYCLKNGKANYAKRHMNGNSYYGRGYVQITHGYNYDKMSKHLGLGTQLYDRPDNVLTPTMGATILLTGMMEGLFRSVAGTLLDYFNSSEEDWYNARDLINTDKDKKPPWAKGKRIGDIVADYGRGFRDALDYI